MNKAKLALMAGVLSYVLVNSAARAAVETKAADQSSGVRAASEYTEPRGDSESLSTESMSSLTQLALGGMSDLGGILTSDMPPPPDWTTSTNRVELGSDDKIAIGGASDVTPSWSQHSMQTSESVRSGSSSGGSATGGGAGTGSGGPGMPKMGLGMKGCLPMGHHHFRCPWEKLEGAYALTDEQYQKLYDIKGQFIAAIVPKGLNVWMLGRKMKDLLNVGDVDNGAVKDVEKQIATAVSDLSMTAMDSIIVANQVFTPAQRKELHRMSIRSTGL